MNDQVLDEPALARFPILRRAALSAPAGEKEYHHPQNGVLAEPLAKLSKKLYKTDLIA
jgi:hypothetical protein